VRSAAQVIQGNVKYMHSKYIKLRKKLATVRFFTNSFKIAF